MKHKDIFQRWRENEAEPYKAGRFNHCVTPDMLTGERSYDDMLSVFRATLSLEYHAAKMILDMPSPPQSQYPLALRSAALIEKFIELFNSKADPLLIAMCAVAIGEAAAYLAVNQDDIETSRAATDRKRQKAEGRARELFLWLNAQGWTIHDLKVAGRDALAKSRKEQAWQWFQSAFKDATPSMFARARRAIEQDKTLSVLRKRRS